MFHSDEVSGKGVCIGNSMICDGIDINTAINILKQFSIV